MNYSQIRLDPSAGITGSPDRVGTAQQCATGAGQCTSPAKDPESRTTETLLRQLHEALDRAGELLLECRTRHEAEEKRREAERQEKLVEMTRAAKKASDEKAMREMYERLVTPPATVGVGRPMAFGPYTFRIDPYMPGDQLEIWQDGKKKLTIIGVS